MIAITLIGRLGRKPEERFTPDGKKITSLAIATDVGYGQNKKTMWWNCQIWGEKFKGIMPYLDKGSLISVTGPLSRVPNIYQGKDLSWKLSPLEITVEIINLVGSKSEDKDNKQEQIPF